MKILIKILSLLLLTLVATVKAQDEILIENTNHTSGFNRYFGQSFTTPDELGSTNILSAFNFLANGVRTGAGNLYLFTDAYTGAPTDLSTAGALAVAAWNSTSREFDFSSDSFILQPDTKYYVYDDAPALVQFESDGTDVYDGGDSYDTTTGTGSFTLMPNDDTTFQLISTTPTPEPSTVALLSFGSVGLLFGLRRRK